MLDVQIITACDDDVLHLKVVLVFQIQAIHAFCAIHLLSHNVWAIDIYNYEFYEVPNQEVCNIRDVCDILDVSGVVGWNIYSIFGSNSCDSTLWRIGNENSSSLMPFLFLFSLKLTLDITLGYVNTSLRNSMKTIVYVILVGCRSLSLEIYLSFRR